jgi:tetraprenyl-beta-curcumene synthase
MAAGRYWLSVFPRVHGETRHWRRRAQQIPDPALRQLAIEAQELKRGNIEGSAAFAAFAPRTRRLAVLRAQVAFQSAYDYVDTLAEQANPDALMNGRQLHRALLVALDRDARHPDYYAYFAHRDDAGYLEEIVDACRVALSSLPSHASIAAPAQRLTGRIVAYQTLNLTESHGGQRMLARWARKATPAGARLRWWETAASAGSSLGLFALIAAAARPALAPADAVAIEQAYWPWVGALHSMLDSLIDEAEDADADQRSLLDYYASPRESAARLQLLAREALRATESLPEAREHALVLAGMVSFYLTAPQASSPSSRLISRGVIDALGGTTEPMMLILRARRGVNRMRPPGSDRAVPV